MYYNCLFFENFSFIGEYFTAVELSEIAKNLDRAEQAALREGTTEQSLNRNSNTSTSQNMDDSGISSKFI